jgi:hypothetical protein
MNKAIILLLLLLSLACTETRNVWVFFDGRADILRLRQAGFRPRYTSTWFNAASGRADKRTLQKIARLPFVKSIRPVSRLTNVREKAAPYRLHKTLADTILDSVYGYSYDALRLMRVTHVFNQGIVKREDAGRGVRIAIFDSGFKTALDVFAHFTDSTVIAKRDYVAGMIDTGLDFDTTVYDDSLDFPGQHDHGTAMLGLLAARKPGELTGIVPHARFALIKTEQVRDSSGRPVETLAEEDAWVQAVEWAVDTLGVDIISSSLNYRCDFTDGREDYGLAALDGDSLMITRAADMAAQKGVVVTVAVGNYGALGPSSLFAPADGDSVIAVGGTFADGTMWNATSYGPTADGRDKPDIAAPGEYWFSNSHGYVIRSFGTSGAAALLAGACALMIQANDSLRGNPAEILRRIRKHAYFPDNVTPDMRSNPRYGPGIVDVYGAITGLDAGADDGIGKDGTRATLEVYPNPFKSRTVISIDKKLQVASYKLSIFDITGKQLETCNLKLATSNTVIWNSASLPAGIYILKAKTGNRVLSRKLVLQR